MIKIKKGTEYDLPWCYWTWVDVKDAINIEANYNILVGEEYTPSEFKEPHVILLTKDPELYERYLGDFCYISVSDNPTILKGNVDKDQFELIKKWIVKHIEPIMKVWIGEFDSGNFTSAVGIKYD
jgi:hypothetical protein